jgi:hypothetical protein
VSVQPNEERIDLERPGEVERWAEKLGVTPQEIVETMHSVGPLVDKVREKLARNRSY